MLQSRLVELDPSLEEAARDLGCPPAKAFVSVALPNMIPAIVSAWLLSFTLSLDDLVISSFTTGPGASTLPMKIYSQIKFGVTPEINAISTIILGIVVLGLVAAQLVSRRSEQRATTA
ncbi:Inner membrane ABC transporter permease protein YdcV [compost metagenome]